MDFDEIVVKDSPGLCRCCLSEGCYKDLSTEYTWMGENEIYADMLFECFDISITQHTEGPNGSSRLICEVCITRLRDACNFKKQVLESEKKFVDMVGRGDFKPKAVIILEATPLKTEFPDPLPGPSEDDCEIEYLDEDDYTDGYRDDEPLQKLQAAGITVSSLSVKGKRGKKRSADTTKPVKAEKKKKTEGKSSKSKSSKECRRVGDCEERKILPDLRFYMKEILQRTNAVPFRWCGGRYRCLYCTNNYSEWNELVDHARNGHEDLKILHALNLYIQSYNLVCLDVNNAKCNVCDEIFINLNTFIDHLKGKHDCKFDDLYRDIFLLFKMAADGFRCAYCDESFVSFHVLYKHTVEYHEVTTKLLCDHCGKGFIDKYQLDKHIRGLHKQASYKCKECGKLFQHYHLYRYHFVSVHKEKTHKCTECAECFYDSVQRRLHERVAHRIGLFKCGICQREYTRKIELTRHTKIHYNQRDYTCTICGKAFYEKRHLRDHLATHSDDRPFQCKFCKKTFPRKRALRTHERIHTNDRRFTCAVCGDAFVQGTSLKTHMKKHNKL